MVGSQILMFFFSIWGGGCAPLSPGPIPVIEHFVQKPIVNNQCDVSLQMYYCTSSVSLDARVLVGLGEFPVVSNEMAMKRIRATRKYNGK